MATIRVKSAFILRRDTAANWSEKNPILREGEEGYETDTGKRKVGDGTTEWNNLKYDSGIVDQTYNPESENSQSGVAVAEAINIVYDDFGTAIDVCYTLHIGNDGIYILPLTGIQTIDAAPSKLLNFNNEVVIEVSKSLDLQAIGFVKNKKYRIEIRDQKVVSLKSLDEIVDKNYNPESENAQSGKAIATEIERVNNTFAPVIKNTKSGETITATDISPIEHTIAVKVSSENNVDLTSVKVKTGGKNLLSYPYTPNAPSNSGITWTVNSDGTIIANGTATARSVFYLKQNISLQAGKMFVQGLGDSYNKGIGMVFNNIGYVYADDKIVNIPDGYKDTIFLFVNSGATVDNVLIKPPFACYNDDDIVKEYEVNSDGTVEGVKSISPQMNIFTDTLGVNIACEYNADTKKYIDNKFAELQALVLEG